MDGEFCIALESAGVRRLLFVSHAHSEGTPSKGQPHAFDRDDQTRCLSSKGKKQAEFSRKWFQALDYRHKAFAVSAARRAVESCQIMCETRHGAGADVSMELVPSLHPLNLSPDAHKLFNKLGYASLKKYYGEEGGEKALNGYAFQVIEDLLDLVSNRISSRTRGDTLSIFGHAVFLNAAARRIACAMQMSQENLTALEELELGDGEGILLEINPQGGAMLRHLHCRALSAISDHPLYNELK